MVKDVAKEYRSTVTTVGLLVSKARKNPKFIEELFTKEHIRQQKFDIISTVVEEMNQKDQFIDSSKSVIKQVEAN